MPNTLHRFVGSDKNIRKTFLLFPNIQFFLNFAKLASDQENIFLYNFLMAFHNHHFQLPCNEEKKIVFVREAQAPNASTTLRGRTQHLQLIHDQNNGVCNTEKDYKKHVQKKLVQNQLPLNYYMYQTCQCQHKYYDIAHIQIHSTLESANPFHWNCWNVIDCDCKSQTYMCCCTGGRTQIYWMKVPPGSRLPQLPWGRGERERAYNGAFNGTHNSAYMVIFHLLISFHPIREGVKYYLEYFFRKGGWGLPQKSVIALRELHSYTL